jgi:hypothetical protein
MALMYVWVHACTYVLQQSLALVPLTDLACQGRPPFLFHAAAPLLLSLLLLLPRVDLAVAPCR